MQIIDTEQTFTNFLIKLTNEINFTENTKLHFKLNLNLREFLIISNIAIPAITKIKIINN